MALDASLRPYLTQAMDRNRVADAALAGGSGDGHPPGMETEVALLKQRADQSDQRLARIEDKLDRIAEALTGLAATSATKDDVKRAENAAWNALGVGAGIAFAVIAIFVGVLAYLQDQRVANSSTPAAPPAITLNLPPWPTPPAAAPSPAPAARP